MACAKYEEFETKFFKLVNAGRLEFARRLAVAETRRHPRDHKLFFCLGFALHAKGAYGPALRATGRALKLAPDCALSSALYGDHLGALGRHNDAIKVFEHLIRIGVRKLASAG